MGKKVDFEILNSRPKSRKGIVQYGEIPKLAVEQCKAGRGRLIDKK